MEKQTYTVKDLYSNPNGIMFINEETTGLEDIWCRTYPREKEKGRDYNPKIFSDIEEAERYLKEIQRQHNSNWKEHGWMMKTQGYKKPMWDIYYS